MNELIRIGPIGPLRPRLIDDMSMRQLCKEAPRDYSCDVGRSPPDWGARPTPRSRSIANVQIIEANLQPKPVIACSGCPVGMKMPKIDIRATNASR